MAVEIASAYISLVPSFRGGTRGIQRALGGSVGAAGEREGQGFGKRFMGALRRTAAVGGGIAAAIGVRNLGRAVAQQASGIQNTTATLTGLLGSARDAADTMDRLRRVARTSPIDYQTYLDAGNSLAYLGVSGEQAENVLGNVGAAITAAGGSGEDMERVSAALLSIVNNGRVYAADLARISDAGVPIFSGLAAHFNTNIENVREMVTAGEVGLEDVLAVMENATGDTFQSMLAASEGASKSFSNQWAIAKDNITVALAEAFLPVLENVLTPAMQRFADVMPRLIEGGIAGIGRVFSALSPLFSQAGEALTSSIIPAFQDLAGFAVRLWPMLQNVAAVVGREIMTALRDLGGIVRDVVLPALGDMYRTFMAEIAPALLSIATTFAREVLPALREMATVIIQSVLPPILSLAQNLASSLGPILRSLASWLQQNSTLVRTLAVALGGAVVAMKAYQGAVLLINGVTRAWAAVQRVLNLVLRANPIGLVVTAIGALVAGLIYAWENSETFRNVVTGVWNAIKSVVMTVVNAVVDAVTGAWNWIRDTTTSVWNAIAGAVSAVWNRISGAIEAVLSVIRKIVTTYFNIYRRIIETVWNVVRAITMAVWNRISGALEFVWKLISGLARTYFGIWRAIFQLGWKAVQKITQVVWGAIRKALEVVWGVISRVGTALFTRFREIITAIWHRVRDVTMAVWRRIRDFLRASFEFIRDRVVNPIREVFGWVTDRARNVRDNVVSAFRTMRDRLRGVFEWIRDKVVGPIRRQFQRIWDKAIDVKDGVVNAFSTVAETIQGAFEGITDGIKAALNFVFGKINDWMISPINNLLDAVGVDKIPELPQFHTGGWVPGRGEVPALLLGGEAVLNPRAAAAMGKEGVDHLNKTGQMLPMGGLLDGLDWLKEGIKQGVIVGIETATGQNLGDGLLAAVRSAGNAGLDKLGSLVSFPGMARDYSVAGTKRFFNGLLDVVEAGENTINEDMATRKNHGTLPHPDDFGNGFAGVAGKVLPPGTYRIGRGPGPHGYNARDLPAPTGTPIYAAAAGVVNRAASLGYSYGIHAGINHGNWGTLYAHMSRRYVGVGDVVRKGQMIGRVGSTGNSTGPHLHLEPDLARLYDRGGYLPTGMSLVYNGTGRPERVLDPKETLAYERHGSAATINMYGPLHEQAQQIKNQMDRDRVLRGRS